jgi:hypothetical protein
MEHALDISLVPVAEEARPGRPRSFRLRVRRVSENAPMENSIDEGLCGALLYQPEQQLALVRAPRKDHPQAGPLPQGQFDDQRCNPIRLIHAPDVFPVDSPPADYKVAARNFEGRAQRNP